mgnify:CR=1 FL=1
MVMLVKTLIMLVQRKIRKILHLLRLLIRESTEIRTFPPMPTSTRALADAREAALGTSTGRTTADCRAGDVERSVLAADRFVEEFGPATSLESGITQTAAWFSDLVSSGEPHD